MLNIGLLIVTVPGRFFRQATSCVLLPSGRSFDESGAKPLKEMLVAVTAILLLTFGIGPALDLAFPRNVFCWGKVASTHVRLVRRREKVIWGVAKPLR